MRLFCERALDVGTKKRLSNFLRNGSVMKNNTVPDMQ